MTVKVTFILKNGTEINRMQTKTLNSPDKFEKQLKSEILAAMKDPASIYSFENCWSVDQRSRLQVSGLKSRNPHKARKYPGLFLYDKSVFNILSVY